MGVNSINLQTGQPVPTCRLMSLYQPADCLVCTNLQTGRSGQPADWSVWPTCRLSAALYQSIMDHELFLKKETLWTDIVETSGHQGAQFTGRYGSFTFNLT